MFCSRFQSERAAWFAMPAVFLFTVLLLLSCTRRAMPLTQDQSPDQICRQFLIRHGWLPAADPCEIASVHIPEVFDKVYFNYNALQKEQGFDLSAYCGKTVMKYVYRLAVFPSAPAADVKATVLYYQGAVIGGDISSAALDGFMYGLLPQERSYDGKDQIG